VPQVPIPAVQHSDGDQRRPCGSRETLLLKKQLRSFGLPLFDPTATLEGSPGGQKEQTPLPTFLDPITSLIGPVGDVDADIPDQPRTDFGTSQTQAPA
jgi:hypothetical protein